MATLERSITVETGIPDRVANTRSFSAAALNLLIQSIDAAA